MIACPARKRVKRKFFGTKGKKCEPTFVLTWEPGMAGWRIDYFCSYCKGTSSVSAGHCGRFALSDIEMAIELNATMGVVLRTFPPKYRWIFLPKEYSEKELSIYYEEK